MKVIDLINKVFARESLPKKINIGGRLTFRLNPNFSEEKGICTLYVRDKEGWYWLRNQNKYNISLDDKVEILEEKPKKIEAIKVSKDDNCKRYIEYEDKTGHHKYVIRVLDEYFANKINELQEAVNYLLEKESDK